MSFELRVSAGISVLVETYNRRAAQVLRAILTESHRVWIEVQRDRLADQLGPTNSDR